LLAENRPFKIALVNPDAVFQVAATVAVEPDATPLVGHALSGDAPQSPNTAGPTASDILESMRICTPVSALVNPVATIVMRTEVGESTVKVTVADPEGFPTLFWAAMAANRLSQRLGMETATATAAAFVPKFKPSTVRD